MLFAQLSDKWKGELMATGELPNAMVNKWLSRATLDIIGEGRVPPLPRCLVKVYTKL